MDSNEGGAPTGSQDAMPVLSSPIMQRFSFENGHHAQRMAAVCPSVSSKGFMTNFATPVYIALLAVMLVLPSPAADWISKVHEFPLIKQMNGSSNDYFTNSRESMMCFPHPESPRLSSYASDHLQLCSGNGHYEIASHQERTTPDAGACHCYGCFSGKHCEHLNSDCDLNIFQYANSCPISFYTIHITEYSSFVCAAVESSSPD